LSRNDTQAIGIIPARFNSVRFPGKPLVDIRGKTMIQRVYERASKAKELDVVVVATDDTRMAKRMTDRSLIENPNVVKVVINAKSEALYFSRSPIPYQRDSAAEVIYRKHIGLYIYRATALDRITTMKPHFF